MNKRSLGQRLVELGKIFIFLAILLGIQGRDSTLAMGIAFVGLLVAIVGIARND